MIRILALTLFLLCRNSSIFSQYIFNTVGSDVEVLDTNFHQVKVFKKSSDVKYYDNGYISGKDSLGILFLYDSKFNKIEPFKFEKHCYINQHKQSKHLFEYSNFKERFVFNVKNKKFISKPINSVPYFDYGVELIEAFDGNAWYIVDNNLNRINNETYKNIEFNHFGFAIVTRKDKKIGLVNLKGKYAIEPNFYKIEDKHFEFLKLKNTSSNLSVCYNFEMEAFIDCNNYNQLKVQNIGNRINAGSNIYYLVENRMQKDTLYSVNHKPMISGDKIIYIKNVNNAQNVFFIVVDGKRVITLNQNLKTISERYIDIFENNKDIHQLENYNLYGTFEYSKSRIYHNPLLINLDLDVKFDKSFSYVEVSDKSKYLIGKKKETYLTGLYDKDGKMVFDAKYQNIFFYQYRRYLDLEDYFWVLKDNKVKLVDADELSYKGDICKLVFEDYFLSDQYAILKIQLKNSLSNQIMGQSSNINEYVTPPLSDSRVDRDILNSKIFEEKYLVTCDSFLLEKTKIGSKNYMRKKNEVFFYSDKTKDNTYDKLYNKENKQILPLNFHYSESNINSPYLIVNEYNESTKSIDSLKSGIIDSQGKWVLEPINFSFINHYRDSLFVCCENRSENCTLVQVKNGNLVYINSFDIFDYQNKIEIRDTSTLGKKSYFTLVYNANGKKIYSSTKIEDINFIAKNSLIRFNENNKKYTKYIDENGKILLNLEGHYFINFYSTPTLYSIHNNENEYVFKINNGIHQFFKLTKAKNTREVYLISKLPKYTFGIVEIVRDNYRIYFNENDSIIISKSMFSKLEINGGSNIHVHVFKNGAFEIWIENYTFIFDKEKKLRKIIEIKSMDLTDFVKLNNESSKFDESIRRFTEYYSGQFLLYYDVENFKFFFP